MELFNAIQRWASRRLFTTADRPFASRQVLQPLLQAHAGLSSAQIGAASDCPRQGQSFAGQVVIVTFRATQVRAVWHSLEYRFLTSVVHAGLAKVVHGCSVICCVLECINECTVGKLMNLVMRTVIRLLEKLSDFSLQLATLVFERSHLLFCRRVFLLSLNADVLELNDSIIKTLERVGDLRIVAYRDSGRGEFNSSFDASNGCTD